MSGVRQAKIVAKLVGQHDAAEEGRIGVAPRATTTRVGVRAIIQTIAIGIETKVTHVPSNIRNAGVRRVAPAATGRPALNYAATGEAIFPVNITKDGDAKRNSILIRLPVTRRVHGEPQGVVSIVARKEEEIAHVLAGLCRECPGSSEN